MNGQSPTKALLPAGLWGFNMGIDNKHPNYNLRAPQWGRCRDTFNGQDAVKKASTAYLPKLGDQEDDAYAAYQQRALFFGAVERTVAGLAGAVMRKDPVIEAPDKLKALFSDITGTGMSLNEFITWALSEQLLQGRIGILPDWDTKADRPILSGYAAEKVVNWHFDDDRQWVVLQESYSEIDPEDEYNVVEAIQYRKLSLDGGVYTQAIYRKSDEGEFTLKDTVEPTRKGAALESIPLIMTNTDGLGYASSKPPLLGLADVNLSHYRTSADLEHGRHLTALPTPWITGAEAGTSLVIGSGEAWVIPSDTARVGFLEYTGQGLQALEKGMTEKSDMMAKLGAQLLSDKAGVEAADSVRLRQNAEVSVLQSSVTIVETAITKALNAMSEWAGLGEVTVKLNSDFVDSTLNAQDLKEIVMSWQTGAVSHDTLLYNLQRGELLPPGITVEDERALIAAEAPVVS